MEMGFQLGLMERGDAYVCTEYMARTGFPVLEARHGYQPFRIGDSILFARYGSVVAPKLSPWKPEMDKYLLRLTEGGIIQQMLR